MQTTVIRIFYLTALNMWVLLYTKLLTSIKVILKV